MLFSSTPCDFAIPLAIPSQARELAAQFAAQSPDATKAEQIYQNTLAVCLVNNYFRILGIPVDVQAGDSWNPAVYLFHDVADLVLPQRGRLDCCPLLVSATTPQPNRCRVSPDLQGDRLGYVVVQIDLKAQEAALLGFAPVVAGEWLSLQELRSPDELIAHVMGTAPSPEVNLRQWLQNSVNEGWERLEKVILEKIILEKIIAENLLDNLSENLSANIVDLPQLIPVRSVAVENPVSLTQDSVASVIRLLQPDQSEEARLQATEILGKIGKGDFAAVQALSQVMQTAETEDLRWQAAISLGTLDPCHPQAGLQRTIRLPLGQEQVLLVVTVIPKPENRLGVWLQVESRNPQQLLPPGLTLRVLATTGETYLQIEAEADSHGRGVNSVIGRRFSPPVGTHFQVQVQLGNHQFQAGFFA
ncbi:MAG: DUF1822 family protein [Microcoleaceae cyanobacterium]